ncbi:MAG TPA: tail fiber domain-containing protein [Ignavibacteria bacterium]|nr:tail fiber domain-containing protein [Ignavibacteria bacterium]
MRKNCFYYFVFIGFFLAGSLSAQITINTSGHATFGGNVTINGCTAIGASPSSSYRLRINNYSGAGLLTGLYVLSSGSAGAILNYGIQGRATSSNGYINYGIYGYASGGGVNWAGYFAGNVYTTGSYQSSDERIKKDISPLVGKDMLSKIGQLKPVRFKFLSETELHEKGLPALNTKEGYHMGLIAQEVEKIFPEVVIDVPQPIEDENGEVNEKSEIVTTKAINYQELTIALLAAVQELQAEVAELKALSGNK